MMIPKNKLHRRKELPLSLDKKKKTALSLKLLQAKRVSTEKGCELPTLKTVQDLRKLIRIREKTLSKYTINLNVQNLLLLRKCVFSPRCRNLRKLKVESTLCDKRGRKRPEWSNLQEDTRNLRSLKGLQSLDIVLADWKNLKTIMYLRELQTLQLKTSFDIFIQYPDFLKNLNKLRWLKIEASGACKSSYTRARIVKSFGKFLSSSQGVKVLKLKFHLNAELQDTILEGMTKVVESLSFESICLTFEMKRLSFLQKQHLRKFIPHVNFLVLSPVQEFPFAERSFQATHREQNEIILFLYYKCPVLFEEKADFSFQECTAAKIISIDTALIPLLQPPIKFPEGLKHLMMPWSDLSLPMCMNLSWKSLNDIATSSQPFHKSAKLESFYYSVHFSEKELESMEKLFVSDSFRNLKCLGLPCTLRSDSKMEYFHKFAEKLSFRHVLKQFNLYTRIDHWQIREQSLDFLSLFPKLKDLKIVLEKADWVLKREENKEVTLNIPISHLTELTTFSLEANECLSRKSAIQILRDLQKNEHIQKISFLGSSLALVPKDLKTVQEILQRPNVQIDLLKNGK